MSAADYRETEKKRQAAARRLEREETEILARMEKLVAEKAALEAELSRPEVYSDGGKSKAVQVKLDVAAAGIDAAAVEWERVAAELEVVRAGA
jgi:ATP-binding cassette subfamily F protein 3